MVWSWRYLPRVECGPRSSEEVLESIEGSLHQRWDPRKDKHVTHTDLGTEGRHLSDWYNVWS